PEFRRDQALLLTFAYALHKRSDDARPGAPSDVKARYGIPVSGRVAAAPLRPPDDGKELDAPLAQPRAFLACREGNVSLGPPSGPLVLFAVEGGRPHPVLQGEVIRIANAHAPLLGGVDEEDAAERP